MRYRFLLVLFLAPFGSPRCQLPATAADIARLERQLPALSGKSKVDMMVRICKTYFGMGFFVGPGDTRVEPMLLYSGQAKELSENISYPKGMDEARLYHAFATAAKTNNHQATFYEYLQVIGRKQAGMFHMALAHSLMASLYSENRNRPDSAVMHFNEAILLFSRLGDRMYLTLTRFALGLHYFSQNRYIDAIDQLTQSLQYFRLAGKDGSKDEWPTMMYMRSLLLLIELYTQAGDIVTAKELIRETEAFYRKAHIQASLESFWLAAYLAENQRDSVAHYLKMLQQNNDQVSMAINIHSGNAYLQIGMYREALPWLSIALDTFRSRAARPGYPNAKRNVLNMLTSLSKTNYELKRYEEAKTQASEALEMYPALARNFNEFRRVEMLTDLYLSAGALDSAIYYQKRYQAIKDSMLNNQLLTRLAAAKLKANQELSAARISLLQVENQLKQKQIEQQQLLQEQKEAALIMLDQENHLNVEQLERLALYKKESETELDMAYQQSLLKEQELKQAAFLRNALMGGAAIILLLATGIIRVLSLKRKNENLKHQQAEDQLKLEKLESEKRTAELNQQATELEMQALRAQMNPHFIFNCLSSINWLILGNKNEAASEYLHRFSSLIRMVLSGSGKTTISLEEELTMLNLYLQMEQLRFEDAFDYTIEMNDTVDTSSVLVPPLLLQPFCENAIWHGLMHRQQKGRLTIHIHEENNFVYFNITDNGIGRKRSAEINKASAKRPQAMGLNITANRIKLFNQANGDQAFGIEDLLDSHGEPAGTRVMIKIRNQLADQATH